MLPSRNLNDRTYEALMEEAIEQIPLYSAEWTNYNPSDPGITILENLTAFQVVQRQQMNTLTDLQREKLLQLAGILPQKEQVSRVLLQSSQDFQGVHLPKGQKFSMGEICYETACATELPGVITGIYGEQHGTRIDYTHQLCQGRLGHTAVFGEQPVKGNCLYLVVSYIPVHTRTPLRLYFDGFEPYPRNPRENDGREQFAGLEWSVYTGQGYQSVRQVRDETGAFSGSGEIALELGDRTPVMCRDFDKSGYVLRCRLAWADYDMPPRIQAIHGLVFPVCQRDTLAAAAFYTDCREILVEPVSMEHPYLFVYGREEKGQDYRDYRETGEPEGAELCYGQELQEDGSIRISFPRSLQQVCLVWCCEAFLQRRRLDLVYGYEQQRVKLHGFERLEEDSLLVMTELKGEDGIRRYQFFHPGAQGEGALTYSFDGEACEIQIEDFGNYEGAQLYLCGAAVFCGEEGNARRGNRFLLQSRRFFGEFTNPVQGNKGRFRESLEAMGQRLKNEVRTPWSAVTAEDYEYLVKQTPGLCIHKVKAYCKPKQNQVTVVVKPYHDMKCPELSIRYRDVICRYLEKRRMLTVNVQIRGPVYVPIDVKAVVFVKKHYENGQKEIRRQLEKELDFIRGDHGFGEVLYFNQVFRHVQELPCIEYMEELSLTPALRQAVSMDGLDIRMREDALCHPGRMELEISRSYAGW